MFPRVFATTIWLTLLWGLVDSLFGSVLQGRVVSSDQKPVPAAQIRLQVSGTAEWLQTVQANAKGEYQIQGVGPGSYELIVFATSFAENSVRGIYLTSQERRTIPDIELNRERMLLIDCFPENPSLQFDLLPEISRGGGLTGIVHDMNGKLVIGATVTVFVSGEKKAGTTTTDHAGHFSLSVLPPRRDYTLTVPQMGIFAEQMDDVAVRKGFVSHMPPIVVEPCQPGQCQPYLKQVRVLPECS